MVNRGEIDEMVVSIVAENLDECYAISTLEQTKELLHP